MAYGETYDEFVKKFERKKTTDDCYTPPAVYEVVKNWAVKEYGLEGRPIIRPFYPDTEYKEFEYPPNCVVIDNPPFSIQAKILDYYNEHNIDYFLFAPNLTMFSNINRGSFVVTNSHVIYENGANVATGFITNLADYKVKLAPDLRDEIHKANKKDNKCKLTKYKYPDNLITASLLSKYLNRGISHVFSEEEIHPVDYMDMKINNRRVKLYGAGFFVSDENARKLKEKYNNYQPSSKTDYLGEIEVELSEREKEIIKRLGEKS